MKFLGISLKTPRNDALPFVGACLIVAVGLGAALVHNELIAVDDGIAVACGFVGAPLAWAYGARLRRDGVRALVLGGLFSLALFGLVRLLVLAHSEPTTVAQISEPQTFTLPSAWAAFDGPTAGFRAEDYEPAPEEVASDPSPQLAAGSAGSTTEASRSQPSCCKTID